MSVFAFFAKYFYDNSKKEKNLQDGPFGKIIAILFKKQWLGTFLFCFFFSLLMALMGKQKAQGADHWWEWLWFFYSGGIKSFIAFGFFYFVGWHMYYQRSLFDKLSIKKQILILIIPYTIIWYGHSHLLKYSDSPYSEQNEIYKANLDKYHPPQNVTFSVDMSKFDFSQFEKDKTEFRGVFLQGSFNNWCGECDKMDDEDGDLIYTKTIQARKGIHKFVFTINGWDALETKNWYWITGAAPNSDCDAAPNHEDNPYAFEVFDDAIVLNAVCWFESCYDCSGNQAYSFQPSSHQNSRSELFFGAYVFLFNFMVPCFIMLILSLFIKLYNAESKKMRYISDASYWVYIIHLPLAHFIPGLFHKSNMNVFLKFGISSLIVTVICFTSYHYLVRSSFIGKFLNGRRYPIE